MSTKFIELTYAGTVKPCLVALDDIACVIPDRRNGSWINRKSQGHFYGIHVEEDTFVVGDRIKAAAA